MEEGFAVSPMEEGSFTRILVGHPRPAIAFFSFLLIIGIAAYWRLPVTMWPNIDLAIVSVSIGEPGASASEVEERITRTVERAVSHVAGVKHLRSSITDGNSLTGVEFDIKTQPDVALQAVRDAVSAIRSKLPRDAVDPLVQRINAASQLLQVYSVASSTMDATVLSRFVDNVVVRAVAVAAGVGRVERLGGGAEEVRVALDPDVLLGLGTTTGDIGKALDATRVHLPAGIAETGSGASPISIDGGVSTTDTLAQTRVPLSGNVVGQLGDIARISKDTADEKTFARIDGKTDAIALEIYRSNGSSDVEVARNVAAVVRQLTERYQSLSFRLIDDNTAATKESFAVTTSTLLEGAALTTIIVFLFLRSWRATGIACLALPLSIVPTFAVMNLLGFSLNYISMLALTLVTGVLVDDAIVEIENITRHMHLGKAHREATISAADEIAPTVVAISISIVAVFAPTSFMSGIGGQYFRQFGLTVAAAVISSLLVARLITPLAAVKFITAAPPSEPYANKAAVWYSSILEKTLRRRVTTVVAGLGIVAASFVAICLLPVDFMPAQDLSRLQFSVEMPPGSRLEDNRATTDEIAASFKTVPGVATVLVEGGKTPGGGDGGIGRSAITVILVPPHNRTRTQDQIKAVLERKLAAIADVRGFVVGADGDREFSIVLQGDDPQSLGAAATQVELGMRSRSDLRNVAVATSVPEPEIRVTPRAEEAALLGISTAAIADAVSSATLGNISGRVLLSGSEQTIPVRVLSADQGTMSLGKVGNILVRNTEGKLLPISAVADIAVTTSLSSIDRFDEHRSVSIGADLQKGAGLDQALTSVMSLPAVTHLPPDVSLLLDGDADVMEDFFSSFTGALTSALSLLLLVLYLLFGSLFEPLVIIVTVPLSISGAALALYITGESVSLPVMIGALLLIGIVAKNAIMLLDVSKAKQQGGLSRHDAIVSAARERARPILMTTVAMTAGMFPSAFGLGTGWEFRMPMAITVIGGLISSTLLSLVFIPAFYTLAGDISDASGRKLRILLTKKRPGTFPVGAE